MKDSAVTGATLSMALALGMLGCSAPGKLSTPVAPTPVAFDAGPTALAVPDAAVATAIDSGETSGPTTEATPEATPVGSGAPTATAPEGMQLVPAGPFTMGADGGGEEDEHPAHTVTLAAFWLDTTEVTNEAYAKCVDASACRMNNRSVARNSHAGPDEGFGKPKQPVVGVSWGDANTYCGWLGRRLPREAEFEKAIRDGDGRRFPWGNEAPTPERTVYARAFGRETTDDVGSHPTGRGPYGHDDLAGNVWEWIADEYDPIAYTRATAATGEPGTCGEIMAALARLRAEGRQGFTGSNAIPNECEHVLRGGAFNYDGPGLRSTNRVHHPGSFRLVMSGFRCAKDAP